MSTRGKSTHRRNYVIIASVISIPVVLLAAISLFSSTPDNLGVRDGRLAACPSSNNCVSTQANDDLHKIAPLEYSGSLAAAVHSIKHILGTFPRIKIVSEDENYLHAEATSLVFRFVDDIEFFFDEKTKRIHFRAASRSGYSDLGTNRSRMEKIRAAFSAAQ